MIVVEILIILIFNRERAINKIKNRSSGELQNSCDAIYEQYLMKEIGSDCRFRDISNEQNLKFSANFNFFFNF